MLTAFAAPARHDDRPTARLPRRRDDTAHGTADVRQTFVRSPHPCRRATLPIHFRLAAVLILGEVTVNLAQGGVSVEPRDKPFPTRAAGRCGVATRHRVGWPVNRTEQGAALGGEGAPLPRLVFVTAPFFLRRQDCLMVSADGSVFTVDGGDVLARLPVPCEEGAEATDPHPVVFPAQVARERRPLTPLLFTARAMLAAQPVSERRHVAAAVPTARHLMFRAQVTPHVPAVHGRERSPALFPVLMYPGAPGTFRLCHVNTTHVRTRASGQAARLP